MTYEKLTTYFEFLGLKHKLINSTIVFNERKFNQEYASRNGLQYPALIFDPYKSYLSGNAQRTFNNRSFEFSVMIKVENSSADALKRARNMAEEIGLQLIARIKHDSNTCSNLDWLYQNFDANNVNYEPANYDNTNGDLVTGMDFSFSLKNKQSLKMNPSLWLDKTRFAFSNGFSNGFR